MSTQVATVGPRMVSSALTLATLVAWPEFVDGAQSTGVIQVNVTVVGACEVDFASDSTTIEQYCGNVGDAGDITLSPIESALPAYDAISVVIEQDDAEVQLITISY